MDILKQIIFLAWTWNSLKEKNALGVKIHSYK